MFVVVSEDMRVTEEIAQVFFFSFFFAMFLSSALSL